MQGITKLNQASLFHRNTYVLIKIFSYRQQKKFIQHMLLLVNLTLTKKMIRFANLTKCTMPLPQNMPLPNYKMRHAPTTKCATLSMQTE